eukprot:3850613-Lingulodinium_polyedra.AAC.1
MPNAPCSAATQPAPPPGALPGPVGRAAPVGSPWLLAPPESSGENNASTSPPGALCRHLQRHARGLPG